MVCGRQEQERFLNALFPDMRFPAHTSAFGTKVQKQTHTAFFMTGSRKLHSVPSVLSMRSPGARAPSTKVSNLSASRRSFSVIVSCKISVVPIEKQRLTSSGVSRPCLAVWRSTS